ncbi:MAG: hypothetical protein K6G55_01240 [Selenomonadaceae bacterium]|nr:hypothetical protein [Selenomonadaceae bacterium]
MTEIIDKERFLIYPELRDCETKMALIPNEIVTDAEEESYFDLNFRLSDVIINSVTRKYANEYPEGKKNGERFLIGLNACTKLRKKLKCPYMRKVSNLIDSESEFKGEEIIAVYLLGTDQARQKFLVMTKNKILLRNDTNRIESYDYGQMQFTAEGLNDTNRTSAEGILLSYPFDKNFLSFAHEFMLLRCATLSTVGKSHPFGGMIIDLKKSYLEFLVDIAAAEGKLTAEKYLRLEYLAREFHVTDKSFKVWFDKAYEGGYKPEELQQFFYDMFGKKITSDKWYVLFQDIIDMAVNDDDTLNRKDLIELIKRDSAAGSVFVTNYIEFVKLRRRALKHLQKAIFTVGHDSLSEKIGGYLKNIHGLQSYNCELLLKITDIAVLTGNK